MSDLCTYFKMNGENVGSPVHLLPNLKKGMMIHFNNNSYEVIDLSYSFGNESGENGLHVRVKDVL